MTASTIETPFNFPSHALKDDGKKKVVFCIPTITKPYQVTLDSLEDSIPLITKAGWDEGTVYQIGCPYVSAARAMTVVVGELPCGPVMWMLRSIYFSCLRCWRCLAQGQPSSSRAQLAFSEWPSM